jgi:hypothetical protein
VNPGVFPLVALALVLLAITVAWPEFWVPNDEELPFDVNDETRGDWERIPHQGHPPDLG